MTDITQPMPPYRLVETHWNDDLQALAARELGDANRWAELVWLNSLVHPYITQDERQVAPGVVLAGSILKVPAPRGLWTPDAAHGQVFERDCEMRDRRLQVTAGGDLAIVAGANNLRQQLMHRIVTPRGQVRRHPNYGNMTPRLIGTVNGPTATLMAAEYTKSAIVADPRVERVASSSGSAAGDSIRVTARAVAIDGGVVDLREIQVGANN